MKKILSKLFRGQLDENTADAKELISVASTVLDLQIQSSSNLELRISHMEEKIDKLTEAVTNLNFAISHLIDAANAQVAILSAFASDEYPAELTSEEAKSDAPKKDKGTLN